MEFLLLTRVSLHGSRKSLAKRIRLIFVRIFRFFNKNEDNTNHSLGNVHYDHVHVINFWSVHNFITNMHTWIRFEFLVEANNPWWTFFSYMFKPTCLGCSGICEVPAPEGCHCIKDTACMQQRFHAMGFPG